MNFLQLPGQTVASNKPRAQVALAPRHGLMDWIRKMNGTPNISGTNGKLLNVTEEELAKHNLKTDCWTAISGNVYNITPYLDFHPGGVDEIMKGAGIDATALFQEIHAWVNFASMLEKCLVGRLVTKVNVKDTASKSLPNRLRFDFRQTNAKTLTAFIYTTCMSLTLENVFVHVDQGKRLTVLVYIDGFVHTIAIELLEPVADEFTVRLSPSHRNQIELELNKQTEQMWISIGKFQSNHLSICRMQDFVPVYFTATLLKRSAVTHDTDWYTFSLPPDVFMSPPIGYHIRLRRAKDGVLVVKPYTVVNRFPSARTSTEERTIELLIKHYADRTMTPMLQQLNIGDTIEMSSFEGTFDLTRIDRCQTLILIAAGTGLTPMIPILNYVAQSKDLQRSVHVQLLFFNKTQLDILCHDELRTLANEHKFTVHHVLSRADAEWTGETGHIRGELLRRLLPPLPPKDIPSQTLVCVCGPTPFSKLTATLLHEQGYEQHHLHVFLA